MDCIGLGVADRGEFRELLEVALRTATPIGSHDGLQVLRWQDNSGARLILALRDGELEDVLPSFAGQPGALLQGVELVTADVASAAVVDDQGHQATALTFEPEQRALLRAGGPVDCPAAILALGVGVQVFADESAYHAADASILGGPAFGADPAPSSWGEEPVRMAAECFLSHGTFAPPGEAEADALLSGFVLSSQRHRNTLTGQEFSVARVRTVGFEADVCLGAGDHPETPQPGQIVSGTVFLAGDLKV